MARIIISYRRSDSDIFAGRVRDRIAGSFGEDSVFIDVDNIPFGKDFRAYIQEALAEADAILVVVGPRWLGGGKGGRSRINDDADPVRIEVETALGKGIPTIPLLVGQTNMPRPEQLPESLKSFAFINAARVDTGRDFHRDISRVIESINAILERPVNTVEGVSRSAASAAEAKQVTADGLEAEPKSEHTETERHEDEAPTKAATAQAQPLQHALIIGSSIGAAVVAAIGIWFAFAPPRPVTGAATPSTIAAQQAALGLPTSGAPGAVGAPSKAATGAQSTNPADPLHRDLVTDCDRLAGRPLDPQGSRGAVGVVPGEIDFVPAFKACNDAMHLYSNVARFFLQAGRVAIAQKNYPAARQLIEQAIDMGSIEAMNTLGLIYQNGWGVPSDYAQARKWLDRASAAGDPNAMSNIGFQYYRGFGVPRDYTLARQWYEKAAAAGDPFAMTMLGDLYSDGMGVPQDDSRARQWYEKAAAARSEEVRRTLQSLQGKK